MFTTSFERARAAYFLDCLANGKPVEPWDARGFSAAEQLMLAGVCLFGALSHWPPLGPRAAPLGRHAEQQEAVEEAATRDLLQAIDFLAELVQHIHAGDYEARGGQAWARVVVADGEQWTEGLNAPPLPRKLSLVEQEAWKRARALWHGFGGGEDFQNSDYVKALHEALRDLEPFPYDGFVELIAERIAEESDFEAFAFNFPGPQPHFDGQGEYRLGAGRRARARMALLADIARALDEEFGP
jgi:hypothetical protein